MAEQEELKLVEEITTRPPKSEEELRRRRTLIGLGVGGTLSLLAILFSAKGLIDQSNDQARADKERSTEITKTMEEDGFSVSEVNPAIQGAIIDLGNCTLRVYVQTQEVDGQIVDTGDYTFGNDKAQFTFQDNQELRTHILGPEPCITLASGGLATNLSS